MKFIESNWCGLQWSDWVEFTDCERLKSVTKSAGIYRIRPKGENRLAYIGQTSRSLRERVVSALVVNTLKDEMPFNDPHTAAASLWAWRDAVKMEFELSVVEVQTTDQERKALESYLLWCYRVENEESTLCNHGRFDRNYFKSKNRSKGIRGGRLPEGEYNPAGESSSEPLQRQGMSIERDWMGLRWSEIRNLNTTEVKSVQMASGLYKLITLDSNEVVYIGQSKKLRSRLQDHANKGWANLSMGFSFVQLPDEISNFPFRMNEWENDLIGAFYDENNRSPRFQFVNAK